MDEEQRRLAEELLFAKAKKPSFAKTLYFGQLDASQIFPYPQPSSDEKQRTERLLHDVDQFISKDLDPVSIDKNALIPDTVIKKLGELGLLGMTIPQKYGGLGMSQFAYCKVVERLARHCGSTALFVNAHQSIGLKALLLFGTEYQKQRWLTPLAQGNQLAAFALTEPNAGSDASGIEARAIYDSQKNVWRINGTKQWITNGGIAQVLTVMVQTSVETPQGMQDKVTAFLVTPDLPGFKVVAPALEKVGMRGTQTAILEFKDVEVPPENILGPIGGGLKVCLTVLDYGRTTFGAMCTGAAKYCIETAIEHAKTRYQFKRPLASFGLVKKKIATMAALAYAMDATTYMTAGLVDAHVEDFMLEAAMLKVFCSDALWEILYETMQIYGGRSFFTDYPYERMMRDARLNMIGEGSNEVMRVFIGVVGMRDVGMQLKTGLEAMQNPFENYNALKDIFKQRWSSLQKAKIPIQSSELTEEADRLSAAIRQFGWSVSRLLVQYREDILEKQLLLNRIASGAMAIYTAMSVLSKLDTDLKLGFLKGEEKEKVAAIAKLYCQMAFSTFDQNLESLFNNEDRAIEDAADRLTGISNET